MRRFKLISLILIPLALSGCAGSKVVSNDNGTLVVKGPRVAWGPGHETYTNEAQNTADQRCAELGRGRASYIGGEVKLFDGDYNKFSCSVLTEKVLALPKIGSSLDQIGKCIRSTIPELDDLNSDAKTVADAVATVCSSTINNFLTLFLKEKQGTNKFNKEYRLLFKENQYAKILPFVLKWRMLIKNGRQNNLAPTEKELPSSMFEI